MFWYGKTWSHINKQCEYFYHIWNFTLKGPETFTDKLANKTSFVKNEKITGLVIRKGKSNINCEQTILTLFFEIDFKVSRWDGAIYPNENYL